MHPGSFSLLLLGSAVVAVIHSVLPDHWVPLAVVGRTQHWSLARVGRIAGLAAAGHVVVSLVLAGIVALVGLRFQRQIDTQQGHIVGAMLILTGLAFLVWGLSGHGHTHGHGHDEHDSHEHDSHEHDSHEHDHEKVVPASAHEHQHAHAQVVHSHPHSHEAYIDQRRQLLTRHSGNRSLGGLLATIAVPFGVAASPDLTILPIALAASAHGAGAVVVVLGIFTLVTMGTFVGLTVAATAVGYQMKGEWLEKHANTITALVLMAIGVVAYVGL